MLSKFRKMIYAFSENARCIQPLLNDTVNLHFKQSTITEILPIPKSDSIRSMLPVSGQPRFWRPYSGRLAGSSQKISTKTVGSLPTGRILAVLADSGQYARVRPFCAGIRQFWTEFGQPRFQRNCSDSSIYLGFWL